jgi:cytochrome c-type biogenesis protein CcmF
VGQELVVGTRARCALTGEGPGLALLSLVTRNRRRYGGYAVHVGIAVLLIGVAASTTFQHVRDVRLRPGQNTGVGGYDIRYVRPTAALGAQKLTLGAVLDVSKKGHHVTTLIPSRGYYPSLDQASLGRIGRFFNGDSTSELGLRPSLTRDIWTAAQPDISPLQPMIRDANRRFPKANSRLEGLVVAAIVRRYMRDAAVVDFRLIVSPLVAWIWIGGVIVVGGAMVALWPAPRRARRRVPVAAGRSARRARAPA